MCKCQAGRNILLTTISPVPSFRQVDKHCLDLCGKFNLHQIKSPFSPFHRKDSGTGDVKWRTKEYEAKHGTEFCSKPWSPGTAHRNKKTHRRGRSVHDKEFPAFQTESAIQKRLL